MKNIKNKIKTMYYLYKQMLVLRVLDKYNTYTITNLLTYIQTKYIDRFLHNINFDYTNEFYC